MTPSTLLGNGNGTFAAKTDFPAGTGPWGIVVGDFNRDSKLDLVLTSASTNAASILLGLGDGTFTVPASEPVGTHPMFPAAGDFDRDGWPDVAVPNYQSNNVSILLSRSTTYLPSIAK